MSEAVDYASGIGDLVVFVIHPLGFEIQTWY